MDASEKAKRAAARSPAIITPVFSAALLGDLCRAASAPKCAGPLYAGLIESEIESGAAMEVFLQSGGRHLCSVEL